MNPNLKGIIPHFAKDFGGGSVIQVIKIKRPNKRQSFIIECACQLSIIIVLLAATHRAICWRPEMRVPVVIMTLPTACQVWPML